MLRSTTEIKRASPEAVLASLRSDSPHASKEAAVKLIGEAKSYGLGLRDYLRLKVDPRLSADEDERKRFLLPEGNAFLNGYESSLAYLGLPTRDDFDGGVTLQLAADNFQTFPGVRAFFPEVVDDMVKWNYRQTNFEKISDVVSQTRTVSGAQVISTVITDTQADYQEGTRAIAEGGRIPIHAIKGSQSTVGFYKFGNGYKTSYEFQRRVALDFLTPYAVRTQTEIEASKVAVATYLLINGDGVNAAADVVTQSSFNTAAGVTATNGQLNWKSLTAWLTSRAKAGAPIDTVMGNWDAYLQWLWLFSLETTGNVSDATNLERVGYKPGGVPILSGSVQFVLSSTVPANQLVGFSKAFTIEEMVEAGSLIQESENSIETQEVTYVNTQDSGFRMIFGDTRSIFNYGA